MLLARLRPPRPALPRALAGPRPVNEGHRRGGFESFTVLLKLGHDLRAHLDDTLSAPLPDAFGPMLDALGAPGDAAGDVVGNEAGAGEASNVVPLAPRRRARTRDEEDR